MQNSVTITGKVFSQIPLPGEAQTGDMCLVPLSNGTITYRIYAEGSFYPIQLNFTDDERKDLQEAKGNKTTSIALRKHIAALFKGIIATPNPRLNNTYFASRSP